jgi:hypothetical protein
MTHAPSIRRPPASPRLLLAVALLATARLAVPASGDAQNVRGRVLDAVTNEPLATTAIELLDEQRNVVARAIANAQGVFFLSAPAAGEYRIRAERIGYTTATLGPVHVAVEQLREVQLRLAADAIPMDALIVASERQIAVLRHQGFYERRRSGFGRFLDRYEIERLGQADRTLDLLMGMPGVRLVYSQEGHRHVVMRGGVARSMSEAYCAPRIVVDGVEAPFLDLDLDLRPDDIEALEIYASGTQAPARFGGLGTGCGVIVVWRRV